MKPVFVPPHDPEAEAGFLGACLVPGAAPEVIDSCDLKREDFYSSANQAIFDAYLELHDKRQQIDIITVADRLRQNGHEVPDLTARIDTCTNVSMAQEYARIVREKSVLRSAYRFGQELIGKVQEGNLSAAEISDFLSRGAAKFIEGARSGQNDLISIREIVTECNEDIAAHPEGIARLMRVKTHLDALDSIIGGFLPGLIYLGARPSIGKTTLATKIALNIGKAGGGVVFFSFEIGQRLLSVRLLSQAVDIPSESVMWGEPPIDLQRVNAGFNRLYNLPIHFAFRPRTVREMLQDCRQIQRQESLAAVFVDRLEIIPERKLPGETENNRLERISQDLNRMANELNIPLVVLLQLNRNSENRPGDSKPRLSDLRNSGAMEQDAKLVLLIHRNKEKPEEPAEIIIAKNMNGPTGTAELHFDAKIPDFTDLLEREW